MEARKARDLGGGTGESVQCPGMPGRNQRRQLGPRYVWNVKRWENPEHFGRQGRMGEGAWADTSKEPRGRTLHLEEELGDGKREK